MNREKIDSLLSLLLPTAKDNFRRDGHLDHVALLFDDNMTLTPVGLNYASQAEKESVSQQLRETVAKTCPSLIIQLCEAWMAEPKKEDFDRVHDAACEGKLSTQPESYEVIYAAIESKDLPNGGFQLVSRIVRVDGQPAQLTEWKEVALPTSGRFARFLK